MQNMRPINDHLLLCMSNNDCYVYDEMKWKKTLYTSKKGRKKDIRKNNAVHQIHIVCFDGIREKKKERMEIE